MSDLTNFKYDISSPDKIDSQIEKGVDFFDDKQGGAVGFTTEKENNLVSQYEKFTNGNIGKTWPEAATSYEKERKGFDEYDVPETYKQILVFPSDEPFEAIWSEPSDTALGHPPQFDSPFMVTPIGWSPIADYVSKYSQPHAASLTLTVPLRKSSMNSGRTNVGDIPEQNFNKSFIGGAPYAHGYPFMITPINIFKRRYPTDPSLTWDNEDGTMTENASKWPNPNTQVTITNNLDRFSQGHNYPYLISEGAGLHDWGTVYESKHADSVPRVKQRGVYSNYILGNQFSWTFSNINVPYGPSSDWAGSAGQVGSIHISPSGQIKAGTRYGAMTDQTFTLYDQGTGLTDIESTFAPQKFANTRPVTGRTSQFADSDNLYTSPMGDETHISWNIPKTKTSAKVGKYGSADYTSAKNTGPFNLNASPDSDLLNQLDSDKYKDKINDKIAFSTRGSNTFTNVPAGLDENNLQSTKNYHDVSDPYGSWGFRQPFILRPIPTEGDGTPGNGRWGSDPINSDTSDLGALAAGADSILSGFVRGAPTFTGLVERNITDKIRIGKFLLTPNGIGFIAKQYVLQALNPTIESKIYNPLSALGIPAGYVDSTDELDTGSITTSNLARLLAGLALPISHPARHVGGLRYEDVNPLIELDGDGELGKKVKAIPIIGGKIFSALDDKIKTFGGVSRISMQSNPEILEEKSITILGHKSSVGGKDWKISLPLMNPNKYLFPVSSAPKSVERGIPTFTGTKELVDTDILKITTAGGPKTKGDGLVRGGTFNPNTNAGGDLWTKKRYETLAYGNLEKSSNVKGYYASLEKDGGEKSKKIVDNIGQQGQSQKPVLDDKDGGVGLGLIKKDSTGVKYVTDLTDKINMHPYGSKDLATDNPDFIKFRFYDVVNNKYIIFRAILSGIQDSITPDYGEHQYLGRPDKLYTYKGADRKISFNFKIYPKTKQELPVLMEKLNYLIGLCYPTYTKKTNRMITPFMELTMGDMFVDTPGLLKSLGVTVEDTSTWEMDEGLQFPKYISCACSFQYIGKYPLHGKGKHYELGWLPDGTSGNMNSTADLGYKTSPGRKQAKKQDMTPLFSENLGQ